MMTIPIKTSTDRILELHPHTPEAEAHFNNPASYSGTILDQINNQRLYQRFFAGKQDLVFLDIGANVGLVSFYAQDSCKRVVAVEPHPDHCRVLRDLAEDQPKVELVEAALAPYDGPIRLFLHGDNTTTHTLLTNSSAQIIVRGLTLSSLCEQKDLTHVDLCKIDIEGSESLVITREQVKANKDRIRAYYMECHPVGHCMYTRSHFESVFLECGYSQIDEIGVDNFFVAL